MDFKKKWLEVFAKDISKSQKQKYLIGRGQFIWHLFSWRLIDESLYLEKEAATKAFDKVDKNDALVYDPFESEFKELNELETMLEVYVVASDWSWTYIKTHEETCGPYFMKKR